MKSSLAIFLLTILSICLLSACGSSLSEPLVVSSNPGDYLEANEFTPGEEIDLKKHVVKGKYTLFDLYSEYCSPCMRTVPRLKELSLHRADIAVRSLNINRVEIQGIDWDSPLAKQFALSSIPAFIIYGPNGNLIADGEAAKTQVFRVLDQTVPETDDKDKDKDK
jgi:thiol-disulfide isomerase/thioredoxin